MKKIHTMKRKIFDKKMFFNRQAENISMQTEIIFINQPHAKYLAALTPRQICKWTWLTCHCH